MICRLNDMKDIYIKHKVVDKEIKTKLETETIEQISTFKYLCKIKIYNTSCVYEIHSLVATV